MHYNRHRYSDPQIGRFVAKDSVGFAGGLNVYQYADNPVEWVDPLGLARKKGGSSGTPNQAQMKVERGQAPSEITRIDEPAPSVPNSQ
ncbi:RHS repeat-associated core domain-containing protein [Achromobacter spanius]|uniref:RHS repeat-associated core domain-containing protein n=1 Tax=Achromobacter spanius TaxID=217203 RepID=UPI003D34624E